MTTTSTFQGLSAESNPSSKVLRPPGGGSSNIFGTEPRQAQNNQQRGRGNPNPNSNTTKDSIFGAPYDPQRDVLLSEKKKHGDEVKGKQEPSTPQQPVERATRPTENTKSNLFGDSDRCHSQSGLVQRGGKGGEFPAYDRSVYADQNRQRKLNTGRVSTHNPITGEAYAGHEHDDEELVARPGKKKIANNSQVTAEGAYNPITGEEIVGKDKEPNGEGDRRQPEPAQSQGSGPAAPGQRNSSRVLAPPGGKSSGLW